MTTSHPELADVLAEVIEAALGRVRVAVPATVLSYDEAKQRATVQPALQEAYFDPVSGTLRQELPRPIANVPVAFPGAGNFSITWPLTAEDKVLLVVGDRSLDEWKSTGNKDIAPQDKRRRFDLTDAIAIPSLRSFASPIPAAGIASSAMVVQGAEIRLGSSAATQWVAIADKVLTKLNTIETTFNTHTHLYVAPSVPAGSVPTVIPSSTVTPTTLAEIQSTKVKSE